MDSGFVKAYKIIAPAIKTAGVYFFTTDSGIQYEVRFGRRQDNILHATIVFGVLNEEYEGEEYVVTNKGEVYRVMTTIVETVLMFMAEHPKMQVYEFTGVAKDGEPDNRLTARISLYKRYLPRIFKSTEWQIDYSNGNTIFVTRNKK